MRRFTLIFIVFIATLVGQTSAQTFSPSQRPFTFEDMMALKRISMGIRESERDRL